MGNNVPAEVALLGDLKSVAEQVKLLTALLVYNDSYSFIYDVWLVILSDRVYILDEMAVFEEAFQGVKVTSNMTLNTDDTGTF